MSRAGDSLSSANPLIDPTPRCMQHMDRGDGDGENQRERAFRSDENEGLIALRGARESEGDREQIIVKGEQKEREGVKSNLEPFKEDGGRGAGRSIGVGERKSWRTQAGQTERSLQRQNRKPFPRGGRSQHKMSTTGMVK